MRKVSTFRLIALATVVLLFSSLGVVASVGAAGTVAPEGYWLVTPQGAVFPYGGASTLFGPASTIKGLRAPIVGIVATPSRNGYWMVAADGGVFAFGQAKFYGSLANLKLHAPIAGIAASPSGHGYWLVGQDGGVFAFGDAPFLGAVGVTSPLDTWIGIAASPSGRGYAVVSESGTVKSFGDGSTFFGPSPSHFYAMPGYIVGIQTNRRGYWLFGSDGSVNANTSTNVGDVTTLPSLNVIVASNANPYSP